MLSRLSGTQHFIPIRKGGNMMKVIPALLFIMLALFLGTCSTSRAENRVWTDPDTDPTSPTSFLVTYCPCQSHFDVIFSNDVGLRAATIPIKWDSVGYLDSTCNTPSLVFSGSRIEGVAGKLISIENENRRASISFECDPGDTIPPGSGKLCRLSLNGLEGFPAGGRHLDIDTSMFWDGGDLQCIHYLTSTGSPIFPEFADTTWECAGMVNMVPDINCPWTIYALKGEAVSFCVMVYWDWGLHYVDMVDFNPPPVQAPSFTMFVPFQEYWFAWQTDQADPAGVYTATFEVEDFNCRIVQEQTRIFLRDYGDVNADFLVDIGDVVYLIGCLYRGGASPAPPEVGDANCDGIVDIGDVVRLIGYLYKGEPPPGC
jgi:hypothetical protein